MVGWLPGFDEEGPQDPFVPVAADEEPGGDVLMGEEPEDPAAAVETGSGGRPIVTDGAENCGATFKGLLLLGCDGVIGVVALLCCVDEIGDSWFTIRPVTRGGSVRAGSGDAGPRCCSVTILP